jgi:hypothetical protein
VTPIVHESLRTRLGTITSLVEESHAGRAPLPVYDRIITELHSARQTIRSLAQSDSEELRAIDAYCAWQQFLARVERSRAVLDGYATAAERAEHASRTLASIAAQRGQVGDEPAVRALELVWRAVKVLNIAEGRRGPEAVGLLGRARGYAEAALAEIANEALVDPPGVKDWAVETLAAARRARVAAIAGESAVVIDPPGKGADVLFIDDLDSFTSCVKLADLPPKTKIIVRKSVMFNLATDEEYIPYPSLEGKRGKKSWFRFF